ncbi:MAG: hypothetical protein DLM69_03535 [Candidatus Chloroheliales bacterium]|nr:MAG: hypothetical protein DLM69_03535 [Chloroflexota bacterium]
MKKIIMAAVFVAVLLISGSGQVAAQAMDPNTLKARTGADFDLYFMRNIITNHQIDVELLRPAPANARHTEIKALALSLMDKRQREADQLIGWLNDWYHNQPDTSMTATLIHMKAMPSMDMGSLNEALHQIADLDQLQGDAYDKQVLLYLIRDHQLAIEAAQLVPNRAARPELKPFAQGLIAEQQGEIDQFSAWLRQWYQVDSRGLPLARATPTPHPALPTRPPATATPRREPTPTVLVVSVAATPMPTSTVGEPPTPTSVTPTVMEQTPATGVTSTATPINPTATPTVEQPTATALPAPSAATPTAIAAAPASSSSSGASGWVIVGVVGVAVAGLLAWLMLRRRTPAA